MYFSKRVSPTVLCLLCQLSLTGVLHLLEHPDQSLALLPHAELGLLPLLVLLDQSLVRGLLVCDPEHDVLEAWLRGTKS